MKFRQNVSKLVDLSIVSVGIALILGLVLFFVRAYQIEPELEARMISALLNAQWCRTPGQMSYWRSPMPAQYKDYVRVHIVGALRDGCFDGHRWPHGEIFRILPVQFEGEVR